MSGGWKYIIPNEGSAEQHTQSEYMPLEQAYIYQNVHTIGYSPRHLDRHVEILQTLSEELFDRDFTPSAERLAEEIASHLEQERATRTNSIHIVLKSTSEGYCLMHICPPSLYRGYVLRSLRPEMVTMRSSIPLQTYPTSASTATRMLCNEIARSRGFHAALIMGEKEELYSESTCPLALVQGRRLLLAPMPYSVEQKLVEQAAQRAGIEVEKRTLFRDDMINADEVLQINWQGITAAKHVDGRQYMAIIAERLAQEMEKL